MSRNLSQEEITAMSREEIAKDIIVSTNDTNFQFYLRVGLTGLFFVFLYWLFN